MTFHALLMMLAVSWTWHKSASHGAEEEGPRLAADLSINQTQNLLDACKSLVQTNNVRSEILAVRALVLVRAARLEFNEGVRRGHKELVSANTRNSSVGSCGGASWHTP